MNYRASQVTRFPLDAARTLLSAESVTIFGIVFANGAAQTANINVHDGEDVKRLTVVVPANDTIPIDIEWVADKGIKLPSIGDANVVVTIFHSAVSS